MDLRDYLRVLRRGWPIVICLVVLGVGAGFVLSAAVTKVYDGHAQLFVAASSGTTSNDLANGNAFTQDRVQSYTAIAKTPAVTSAVIKQLGLNLSDHQLSEKISADAPPDKVLINVHAIDHDPRTAARIANAVARQFVRVVEDTEQTDANGKPVVKLTVIYPAAAPRSPVKPNKSLNVSLGAVIGLLLGIGFVILRDLLDDTIKGTAEFEELGVSVLGVVPFDKRVSKAPIAIHGDPHSVRSEAYRQLRTNLQFVNVDDAPRVIAVTSAVPGEGKSTTAINLAAVLAEAGHRVCLVEADLRHPTIAATLGLRPIVGFTSLLIGQAELDGALQSAGHNIDVLTSGPTPPNPSELLISDQARAVIRAIAERVDFTIIDTAPLLPVADGAEVATLADATLLVHRADRTTREQAVRSIAVLAKVDERPIGVVLNMVSRSRGIYDDKYSYYAGAASAGPDRRRMLLSRLIR